MIFGAKNLQRLGNKFFFLKLFESQIAKLKISNREYRKFAEKVLGLLLEQDSGNGDSTTALLANPRKIVEARIVAKSGGILAGGEEVEFFATKKGVEILARKKDGAEVRRGEEALRLKGEAGRILLLERTVLNLLQRMSGIATVSNSLARKIGRRKFAATRKTPLGLLDKKAVVVGGGLPHRLNLNDQILVKENHLAVDPDCWRKILSARKRGSKFFEIEADSEKLAFEVAEFFRGRKGLILLLDNFAPAKLKSLVPKIRKINPKIILEGSGGITAKNAKAFLKSGVDFVSIGELTHSARVLDFSLEVFS